MPLDMFQRTQSDTDAYVQRNNSPRLPAGFSDAFNAAWTENRMFGQSIAGFNARQSAIGDYIDEVTAKTGERFADINPEMGLPLVLQEVNRRVAKMKESYPDLDLQPLDDAEIDRRALAKSKQSRADFQEMQAREKTTGGVLGSLAGGAAGTLTDPVNLVAAPLAAPEGLGLLGTALAWGAIAGGSQAAIEAIGSPYRDQVSPGYSASGEPARNILEAAGFGGAIGGAFKGLGMAWTRAKTGEWPRSVRDAGNVVESEANVANTNVLPGLNGEVAHREALGKAIDDVFQGRPVDVGDRLTAPLTAQARVGANGEPLDLFASHEARLDQLMGERAFIRGTLDTAQTQRAAAREAAAPALPFEPNALEVSAEQHADRLAEGVADIARNAGYNMPREEALRVAQLVAKSAADEDARAILNAVADRPQTVADFPPSPLPKAKGDIPAPEIAPKAATEMAASPQHAEAVRADLDRTRATSDVKIPAGVDEKGEPIFRSLDEALGEVDGLKAAADHIQACANPVQETAE